MDTSYFVSGYIDDTYFVWERYGQANLTVDTALQAEVTKSYFIYVDADANLIANFSWLPGTAFNITAPTIRTSITIVGNINA